MFGTIAEMRARPGKKAELVAQLKEYLNDKVPGAYALYLYQMDVEPEKYYMVLVFESKQAYIANAASPERESRYSKVLPLLESSPNWHDGEIACAVEFAYGGL